MVLLEMLDSHGKFEVWVKIACVLSIGKYLLFVIAIGELRLHGCFEVKSQHASFWWYRTSLDLESGS